jgi:hypothetical protein
VSRPNDGKRIYFDDVGLEIVPQFRKKRETKEHPDLVAMWQARYGAALSAVLGALLANGSPGALGRRSERRQAVAPEFGF